MPGALLKIGTWAATCHDRDWPAAVTTTARRALIDTFGCALAGQTAPQVSQARMVAPHLSGPGPCTALGLTHGISAPAAAFVNGTAAHALDFDDNSYAGVVHGSAVIIPAALAMAQAIGVSGSDLLTAIVVGSEVQYVIGAALGRPPYDKGWWTTALYGPVGAAAAAGRLLGLDGTAFARALGIALAGTGGSKSAFGTDAKALLAGRAAETGLTAALLAHAGAQGPIDALDRPGGLADLVADGHLDQTILNSLGNTWRLLDPGLDIKRIPVCLSSHAAVDALQDIVQTGVAPQDITHVLCDVPPIIIRNLIHDRPRTPTEARFSMPFAIATALLYGDVTLSHLEADAILDPQLQSAMERVKMVQGPEWDDPLRCTAAPEGAVVTVTCRDGSTHTVRRDYPRGAACTPLSESEVDAKFLSCAQRTVPPVTASRLLESLRGIETVACVAEIFAPLKPHP